MQNERKEAKTFFSFGKLLRICSLVNYANLQVTHRKCEKGICLGCYSSLNVVERFFATNVVQNF